jgi:hypothetical protein
VWLEWLVALAVFLIYVAVMWWNFRVSAHRHALNAAPMRTPGPGGRLLPRSHAPQPRGRPLELIARDARRLGSRFQNPPPATSFAKLEGLRRAYDHVLVEACTALEVEHLLEVLPPGDELDAERVRVEGLLWLAGLRIDEAA